MHDPQDRDALAFETEQDHRDRRQDDADEGGRDARADALGSDDEQRDRDADRRRVGVGVIEIGPDSGETVNERAAGVGNAEKAWQLRGGDMDGDARQEAGDHRNR